jgi:hypothetical protein
LAQQKGRRPKPTRPFVPGTFTTVDTEDREAGKWFVLALTSRRRCPLKEKPR